MIQRSLEAAFEAFDAGAHHRRADSISVHVIGKQAVALSAGQFFCRAFFAEWSSGTQLDDDADLLIAAAEGHLVDVVFEVRGKLSLRRVRIVLQTGAERRRRLSGLTRRRRSRA